MEACKEGQWVKVLAVKFDDDLSLLPGSYRVDGESTDAMACPALSSQVYFFPMSHS